MTITINGQPREFDFEKLNVTQLVEQLALGYPVLVELNGKALFQREFSDQMVAEGDKVELFRMVSGG